MTTLPTFEQFAAQRRYQPSLAFSPDGDEIAYISDVSGQFNIWRIPSAGGYPVQVTTFQDRSVRQVSWSPDGETLAFAADLRGNEQFQIHLVAAREGWPREIPSEPDVQHILADAAWSPDGRSLALSANDRDPMDQDALLIDAETGERRRVFAAGGYFHPLHWSPDGRHLIVADFGNNTDNNLYLVDLEQETHDHLNPHEGRVRFYSTGWLPDGSGFLVLSDLDREFVNLARFDLATRELTWLETPEWDIESAELSADGSLMAWVVNEDGFSRLYVRELDGGTTRAITGLPDGVLQVFVLAPHGRSAACIWTTATRPAELYSIDLELGAVVRLTNDFPSGIPAQDLIAPDVVRFPGMDDREIPALLYRPRGEGPFGALLSIHGGPEWQERPGYDELVQYLVSRGIAVFGTNIRGSTGYGKSYQYEIYRDWGGGDLEDFEAAAQYLRSLPWIDPERIGVFGGSYGGFATLSCVTRLPDYWAAAVDIVGPSNLVTFAKAVPPTWRRFMSEWLGDPETEVEFLMERSPISYVDRVRCPLFVIQGANDPRVVQSESEQVVEQLRERGVEVRYDIYEDEGHGFTKTSNRLRALKDSAEFLERYLGRKQ